MKSLFGWSETTVAALSYLFGPITGIFVFAAERENKFVRFHALQSILWFLLLWILFWVIGFATGLPIIGWLLRIPLSPIRWVLGLVYGLSKLYLMLRALMGSEFKLPVFGDVAWNQVNK